MERAALALLCAQVGCLAAPPASTADNPDGGDGKPHSLEFFGNAYLENGVDRVWIPAQRPNPIGRIGDGKFTVELFLKAEAPDILDTGGCPTDWWMGTIVLDREFNETPQNGNVGLALYRSAGSSGVVIGFTVLGQLELTLCGAVDVGDGEWHHVAMTRDNSDRITIWVDGSMDVSEIGPTGDGSFAQDLVGEEEADRYLVLGGPKQEFDVRAGFIGFIDDFRISNRNLYTGTFPRPDVPLAVDIDYTLGLYTFDEGEGIITHNLARELGDGELRVGGDPMGPVYSDDIPLP